MPNALAVFIHFPNAVKEHPMAPALRIVNPDIEEDPNDAGTPHSFLTKM
jgi:hypothetical protein